MEPNIRRCLNGLGADETKVGMLPRKLGPSNHIRYTSCLLRSNPERCHSVIPFRCLRKCLVMRHLCSVIISMSPDRQKRCQVCYLWQSCQQRMRTIPLGVSDSRPVSLPCIHYYEDVKMRLLSTLDQELKRLKQMVVDCERTLTLSVVPL